jgi:hypothetical protein
LKWLESLDENYEYSLENEDFYHKHPTECQEIFHPYLDSTDLDTSTKGKMMETLKKKLLLNEPAVLEVIRIITTTSEPRKRLDLNLNRTLKHE